MSVDAVRIKKLDFEWVRHQPVLHIEELYVPQGEHVYIKGRSGSGKSTLLSLLAGIETRYVRRVIVIRARSCQTLSILKRDQFRADNLGYIFQQFNLLPYLSVLENALLGMQFSKRKKNGCRHSKKRVEAESILSALHIAPEFFEKPVYQLSVGQQQRVAQRVLY